MSNGPTGNEPGWTFETWQAHSKALREAEDKLDSERDRRYSEATRNIEADHTAIAETAERLASLEGVVKSGFEQIEKDTKLAREASPKKEDIAADLVRVERGASEKARDEAERIGKQTATQITNVQTVLGGQIEGLATSVDELKTENITAVALASRNARLYAGAITLAVLIVAIIGIVLSRIG